MFRTTPRRGASSEAHDQAWVGSASVVQCCAWASPRWDRDCMKEQCYAQAQHEAKLVVERTKQACPACGERVRGILNAWAMAVRRRLPVQGAITARRACASLTLAHLGRRALSTGPWRSLSAQRDRSRSPGRCEPVGPGLDLSHGARESYFGPLNRSARAALSAAITTPTWSRSSGDTLTSTSAFPVAAASWR